MMTKNVDHYVCTALLVDSENYPPVLKRMYTQATRDKSITFAVERVVAARQAFLDECGFSSELQHAVLAAANAGDRFHHAVLETLQERELEFLALREEACEAQRAWKTKCDKRYEEIRPLLNGVMRELLDLPERAKSIEQRVATFERAREATRDQLKVMGHTDSEIAAKDLLKPTPADRAQWLLDLEQIRARESKLSAFLKSAPFYDEGILGTEASA
ncbi:hypothetical protein [Cupriavidus pinatubonensis]|uniref:Uncharacterized protein n=1 Tax=Cupriavidus pinatubonensis TaxID=248026 RepID=A0ABM8W9E7_9BURK|nr:hypothetical protein [Cupriavidus pinatubonensis]CAG9163854.1 hypothetical protein LMG23994_00307 [Cupriavidus pinatubonensis]